MKKIVISLMALVFIYMPLLATDDAQVAKKEGPSQKKVATRPVLASPVVIAHIHLSGELTETPINDPFGFLGGQLGSLKEMLRRMHTARDDKNVKAVVITYSGMSLGYGQLYEINKALGEIRTAGKRVFVHSEGLSTGSYALLSAASDFSMVPHSTIDLMGLYGEKLYLKGLLDKIGVEADYLHIGDYKSAGEMLTRVAPSKAANDNINWIMDSLYDSTVQMIAAGRHMSPEKVRRLIDEGPYTAERAKAVGLIDSIQFRQDFLAGIKKQLGDNARIINSYAIRKGNTVNFNSPFAFFSLFSEMLKKNQPAGKDTVALIFVEGPILSGYGQASFFGPSSGAYSGDIRKAFEKAADDPKVKAVVMRVDSPGGSAVASEVILNAARAVQAAGKPLVVSMGNVAASGGYYVACEADHIFADKTTITASIGVVGGKLVTGGMWDKLGINWVGYKRGANADLFSSASGFSQKQRQQMRKYMADIYEVFKNHVLNGRGGKLAKPIEEIAGGRVYTGSQALKLGLVDEIGDFSSAIKYAAAQAGLKNFGIRIIPEPEDFVQMLVEQMSGERQGSPTDLKLGMNGPKTLFDCNSDWAQAFLPVLEKMDPQRYTALRQALQRLELIHKDGIALMMSFDFIVH